jgi:hypothetical protein
MLHSGDPITRGTRYILAVFLLLDSLDYAIAEDALAACIASQRPSKDVTAVYADSSEEEDAQEFSMGNGFCDKEGGKSRRKRAHEDGDNEKNIVAEPTFASRTKIQKKRECDTTTLSTCVVSADAASAAPSEKAFSFNFSFSDA